VIALFGRIEYAMKTRTEEEMLALILGFAQADDNIWVVVMNGSRVNRGYA